VDLVVIMIVVLVALIALLMLGIHIGIVLGSVALGGAYLLFGDLKIVLELANQAAYAVLRNSVFSAIPLFVLMGEFMSRSGMAGDLYRLCNTALRALPGRLAVATVFGNALFATVTGVSIASAMAFSRIAYPEMRALGYDKMFAVGSIAGSASLGMLIPPSVLMIVWGIVTELSIGKIFLAGFIPGLMLAALMAAYCAVRAGTNRALAPAPQQTQERAITMPELISGLGVIALILLVLGGLFAGFFTPSESAAVGCAGSMVFAYLKGARWKTFREAVITSGKTIAPILFLLMMAAMYSKFLALAGIIELIKGIIDGLGLGNFGVTILMVVVWLILGCLIDSISIILLTVPIFWPLAQAAGWDANAFAIFGILAIEAGLLTPPFGLLVFTVKAAIPDQSITIGQIFRASTPYWLLMLAVMITIWVWPITATYLTK
jgi:tripartite ATP-independent transporter DctM subunit